MSYTRTVLKEIINIESIRTVHYFEYSKDFVYPGEKHDFWELVYVDKGNMKIEAGERKLILNQGDVYFHKPMQWHSVAADGVTAPNLAVISFDCHDEAMDYFADKLFHLDPKLRTVLSNVISETENAFTIDAIPKNNKLKVSPCFVDDIKNISASVVLGGKKVKLSWRKKSNKVIVRLNTTLQTEVAENIENYSIMKTKSFFKRKLYVYKLNNID